MVGGDRDPGDVRRAGDSVRDPPDGEERVGIVVGQESEPREDRGDAHLCRGEGEDLDLEDVAGLGALDGDRPGQRMAEAAIDRLDVGGRRIGVELAVDAVARLDRDLFAGRDTGDRIEPWMPAIVPGARLLAQAAAAIDLEDHAAIIARP